MEVMEGSGFEVSVVGEEGGRGRRGEGGVRGTLREEVDVENVLHFECFSLSAPAPLAGISVWSLALASKSTFHPPQHIPLNILKSNT